MCIRDRPALDLAHEVRLHAVMRPVEVFVVPGECKVAPMDHELHFPLRVVEAAGAGLASREAEALQRLC
eukprot:4042750-Alexandrium_andersonii.AAC.1